MVVTDTVTGLYNLWYRLYGSTGVLREANQTCVNVYDVIEMCAPAAPPIMLRIRTRSPNPNPKPLTLTLTLFLTVTGTKFLKENKTGQK